MPTDNTRYVPWMATPAIIGIIAASMVVVANAANKMYTHKVTLFFIVPPLGATGVTHSYLSWTDVCPIGM